MTRLVEQASRLPEGSSRGRTYAEIQVHIDRDALIVQLLVPRCVAVVRSERARPVSLDIDLYRTNLVGACLGAELRLAR